MPRPTYVLKAEVKDPGAATWRFPRRRTMYGGKHVAVGDVVYLFASENAGGDGLVARGVVTAARAVPRRPGVARQTPCVDVEVRRVASVVRRLGRRELKPCSSWADGRPETELNFKLYRQATDKLVGVSPAAAAFLARRVRSGAGAGTGAAGSAPAVRPARPTGRRRGRRPGPA